MFEKFIKHGAGAVVGFLLGILLVIYIGPESEGGVVLLIVIAIAFGILGGLVAKAAYRFVARNRS